MSYYEDYVADGLCCQQCGDIIDFNEPGFPRTCEICNSKSFQKQDKIERNKKRNQYAIEQFKKHDVVFVLKNEKIGHFHVYRKRDRQLFQFWAGTGKIIGDIGLHERELRGINALIKLLEDPGNKIEESYLLLKIDFKNKENSFEFKNIEASYIDFLKENNQLQYFFNQLAPKIKNKMEGIK